MERGDRRWIEGVTGTEERRKKRNKEGVGRGKKNTRRLRRKGSMDRREKWRQNEKG